MIEMYRKSYKFYEKLASYEINHVQERSLSSIKSHRFQSVILSLDEFEHAFNMAKRAYSKEFIHANSNVVVWIIVEKVV